LTLIAASNVNVQDPTIPPWEFQLLNPDFQIRQCLSYLKWASRVRQSEILKTIILCPSVRAVYQVQQRKLREDSSLRRESHNPFSRPRARYKPATTKFEIPLCHQIVVPSHTQPNRTVMSQCQRYWLQKASPPTSSMGLLYLHIFDSPSAIVKTWQLPFTWQPQSVEDGRSNWHCVIIYSGDIQSTLLNFWGSFMLSSTEPYSQTWEPGISDVSRGMLGGYPEIQNSGVEYPAYPW